MRQDVFLRSWLSALFLLFVAGAALADGVLLSATGTVYVQKVFGGTKIVGPGSTLKAGETVGVEKASTARIRFTDGSELLLKPGTRVKLDKYNYVESQPKDDAISYNLLQGSLRAISGAIGKRGNHDAYQANTPSGTIGIRGTEFILISCDTGCPELLAELPPEIAAQVKPGSVFFGVLKGAIEVSNEGGRALFSAVQWGLIPGPGEAPIPVPATSQLQKAADESNASVGALGIDSETICKIQ